MPSADPRKLTDTVLTALKTTGQRAIIATGWGGLVKDALPDDVVDRIFLLEKAPHSWLFPRCTAIVHHGGAGTTHEAIRWGKPSLVCPVFGDQPFWGARVHEIGAGPKPIRQKSLTADKLAQALRTLEDPSYRAKAQRAAEIMTREPSAKGTAERLMQLLAGRQGSKPARQKPVVSSS
ncbi:glycosyltransferase [Roseibium salinum]